MHTAYLSNADFLQLCQSSPEGTKGTFWRIHLRTIDYLHLQDPHGSTFFVHRGIRTPRLSLGCSRKKTSVTYVEPQKNVERNIAQKNDEKNMMHGWVQTIHGEDRNIELHFIVRTQHERSILQVPDASWFICHLFEFAQIWTMFEVDNWVLLTSFG